MARRNKNIRVRGVRRSEPDVRKLSRALIALAEAQLETEAEAAHRTDEETQTRPVVKPALPSKRARA